MARFLKMLSVLLVGAALAACTTSEGPIENGPRLISEVTLPPVTTAPTRALSPSPGPTRTDEPTDVPPPVEFTPTASEQVVVSPTDPPSKTPTITPSVTTTALPTITPFPTATFDPRPTEIPTLPVLVPTMVYMPPPTVAIVAQAPDPTQASPVGDVSLPLPGVPDVPAASCSIPWFFTTPRLPDCPPNAATDTQAAAQFFWYGKMFWIGSQDAIYVLYDNNVAPRWQVFQDTFEDGMPEADPNLDLNAPPYADWQPRRGFGLIWRNQENVRARIGWAESAYEQPYNARLQIGNDGTIYLLDPNNRVYALSPNGNWAMYGSG
jgi:hypothetical protein